MHILLFPTKIHSDAFIDIRWHKNSKKCQKQCPGDMAFTQLVVVDHHSPFLSCASSGGNYDLCKSDGTDHFVPPLFVRTVHVEGVFRHQGHCFYITSWHVLSAIMPSWSFLLSGISSCFLWVSMVMYYFNSARLYLVGRKDSAICVST